MSVLPSRRICTPSPCSTNSTSGNAAPPWETRYAGPVSGDAQQRRDRGRGADGRRFRTARRVRGELRFGARFLQRRQPRRQDLRQLQVDFGDVRFAGLLGDLDDERGTVRFARLRRRGGRERGGERQRFAAARLEGVESSASETFAPHAPRGDRRPRSLRRAVRRVQREPQAGRCRRRRPQTSSGMPSTIVGNGSLLTVTCAVSGIMYIAARTTTVPRSNGPATAGTTTTGRTAGPHSPSSSMPARP